MSYWVYTEQPVTSKIVMLYTVVVKQPSGREVRQSSPVVALVVTSIVGSACYYVRKVNPSSINFYCL